MIFGKYVNVFYKKYFIYLLGGLLALIFVDVIQIFLPKLIGNVVNVFSDSSKSQQIIFDEFFNAKLFDPNGFLFFSISLALIALGMFLGRMGWRFTLFKLASSVDYDLRKQMFLHAEELGVEFYKNQKIGSLMSLFNNDLYSIRNCFVDGVIQTIDGFVMAPLVIISMFINNWVLTLFSIIPLILLMVICFVLDKGLTIKYEASLKAFDKLSDFTQESFSGISVVKAFAKEVRYMQDFALKNKGNKQANKEYLRYSIILNVLIEFLINSVFVVIIFVGVNVMLKNPSYKVGSLVEFIGYLSAAIWPFIAIAQVLMVRARGKAGLKLVTEFLDTKNTLKDVNVNKDELVKIDGDILFKDFNFHYPDSNTPVLNNINLHIKKGQNIGIVGKTGSGKSTLVKCLLKIYNIDDGHLFFNGVDVNKLPGKYIKENIGYVSQNAYLFSDLIKNNIAFYDEEVDFDKIEKAAKFACIDDSIKSFKDGYLTMVGEKGTSLSGGQKQRIAISRAVIKDPAILILDDSVSAVDSETEKQILENIHNLRKGKTTFIVSSRVSVVENLDCIIVMNKGRIIGCGRHEDLLKTCQEYKDTVLLQSLEGE